MDTGLRGLNAEVVPLFEVVKVRFRAVEGPQLRLFTDVIYS